RDDALHLPQVLGAAAALDLAVHRVLEQDRAHDTIAVERRARDDAGPHLVDEVEHLLLVRVGVFPDPVQLQRLRRAAPALVQRRDESIAETNLLELLPVHDLLLVRCSTPGPGPDRGRARVPGARFDIAGSDPARQGVRPQPLREQVTSRSSGELAAHRTAPGRSPPLPARTRSGAPGAEAFPRVPRDPAARPPPDTRTARPLGAGLPNAAARRGPAARTPRRAPRAPGREHDRSTPSRAPGTSAPRRSTAAEAR